MAKRSDILWRLCYWYTTKHPNLSIEQLVEIFRATAQPIKRARPEDIESDAAKLWRMIQTEILKRELAGGYSHILWYEMQKVKCSSGHISMAYAHPTLESIVKCQYIEPSGEKCDEWAEIYKGK